MFVVVFCFSVLFWGMIPQVYGRLILQQARKQDGNHNSDMTTFFITSKVIISHACPPINTDLTTVHVG